MRTEDWGLRTEDWGQPHSYWGPDVWVKSYLSETWVKSESKQYQKARIRDISHFATKVRIPSKSHGPHKFFWSSLAANQLTTVCATLMDSNLRKMCISDIICLIFSFDWFEEFLFDLNLDRLLSSFKAKGRQVSILKTLCRYSISWHHLILLRQEILTIPLLSWTTHIDIDIDIDFDILDF